jgi:spore maturation protein CgeB
MIKKILFVAGELNSSFSYEYQNFLVPLEKLGYTVLPYDFSVKIKELGREKMNQHLLNVVLNESPQLVLFVPQTDQFIPEIVDEINKYTTTLAYLYDDMWRIEYSRFWAKHFRFITTSDLYGLSKYKDNGITNVIYSPFACNTDIYCKKDIPKLYDVSFIGGHHPNRSWFIKQLTDAGIQVNVWGRGWPSGVVNYEQMIDIFNQSRINLNLSNCVSWDFRYIASLHRPLITTLRVWKAAWETINRKENKTVEQVKARHFEINACGGFQLSYYVDGLEHLYRIGDEISIYLSPEDLIEKVKFYLKHEDERERIALNGLKRTKSDHSMEGRLLELLRTVSL